MGIFSTMINESQIAEITESALNDVPVYQYDNDTSIEEAGLIAYYESELEWNKMMQNVMLAEMSVLESTGQEMIYEAADVKSFFKTVVGFFKGLWAKISGLFGKFFTAIKNFVSDNKKFVEKNKEKILAGYKAINDGTEVKSMKWCAYTNIKNVNYGISDIFKSFSANGKSYNELIKWVQSPEDTLDITSENVKDCIDKYRAALMGKSESVSQKEFAKTLREYLRGKCFEELTKANAPAPEGLMKEVSAAKETQGIMKMAYNETKKSFDGAIKSIQDIEKYAIKSLDRKDRKDPMKAANVLIQYLKGAKQAASKANSIQLSELHKYISQSKSILTKYIAAAPAAAKEEKTNESVLDMFNFDLV